MNLYLTIAWICLIQRLNTEVNTDNKL